MNTAKQILADFDEDRDDIRDMCEAESPVSIFTTENDVEVFVFDDGSSINIHHNGNVEAMNP